jgi:hypothetical protein
MNSIQSIKTDNSLPIERSAKDVQPLDQFAKSFASLMGEPEKPELTAETAKLLMYRSMTTGVPTWEIDKFGGYEAVKAVFEANGGQYDILSIPDDLRRELAQKVSESGVGNMLAAKIENLPIAASALQALSDAGVDSAVIDQLRSSGREWAESLKAGPAQSQPAERFALFAAENPLPSSPGEVPQEQSTTAAELKQAIEEATALTVSYVDSSSYLNNLFKG